jgi:glycosyltransferase 2 family protein
MLRVAVKAGLSIGLVALLLAWSDVGRLWALGRNASIGWLAVAAACYASVIAVSAWRWGALLKAQGVRFGTAALSESFLVATFFNNFLPSNIGGDVVRVTDTARAAGSKTLAATVVLVDRGLGVLALGLVAAAGASVARSAGPIAAPVVWTALAVLLVAGLVIVLKPSAIEPICRPLRRVHAEWIDERLARFTGALERFRTRPGALALGFGGALAVHGLLVLFYAAIVHALGIAVRLEDLAVVVPASFLVQMAPVSLNGLGVREATFGFYFARLGLPLESALLVSLAGAALVLLFSLAGAGLYLVRSRKRSPAGILENPQVLDRESPSLYPENSDHNAPQALRLP